MLRENLRSLLTTRGHEFIEHHGVFNVLVQPPWSPRGGARLPPPSTAATERNRVNLVSSSSAAVMRACQPHHQRHAGSFSALVGGGGGGGSNGDGGGWSGSSDPLPRDMAKAQRHRQQRRQQRRRQQQLGGKDGEQSGSYAEAAGGAVGLAALEAELEAERAFEEALEASAREEEARQQQEHLLEQQEQQEEEALIIGLERLSLLEAESEEQARAAAEVVATAEAAAAAADLPPAPNDLRRELSNEGRALLIRAVSGDSALSNGWIPAPANKNARNRHRPPIPSLIDLLDQQLVEMGFTDSEQNRRCLQAHVGRSSDPLAAALEDLTRFQGFTQLGRTRSK